MFKNHVRLCAYTTAAIFFLQSGLGVSAVSERDSNHVSPQDGFSVVSSPPYTDTYHNAYQFGYSPDGYSGREYSYSPYEYYSSYPYDHGNDYSTGLGDYGESDARTYPEIGSGRIYHTATVLPEDTPRTPSSESLSRHTHSLPSYQEHSPESVSSYFDRNGYMITVTPTDNNIVIIPKNNHNSVESRDRNASSRANIPPVSPSRSRIPLVMPNDKEWVYYTCIVCGKNITLDNNKIYKITNDDVKNKDKALQFIAVSVKNAKDSNQKIQNARVTGNNITIYSEVPERLYTYGVRVLDHGKAILPGLSIKNAEVALYAHAGKIIVSDGKIDESHVAVKAVGKPAQKNSASIILKNTTVKTTGSKEGKASPYSFYVYENAKVEMTKGSIDFTDSNGIYSAIGGEAVFDGVTITAKGQKNNPDNFAVFVLDKAGNISFKKGNVKATDLHGILLKNTHNDPNAIPLREDFSGQFSVTKMTVKNSTIKINGEGSHGIYFGGEKQWEDAEGIRHGLVEYKIPPRREIVDLQKTVLNVTGGAAVYSMSAVEGTVNLLESTLSSENLLLKAEKNALVVISAHSSTLQGGAYTDESSTAEILLKNNSRWDIRHQRQGHSREAQLQKDSSVSYITLNNSSIDFGEQKSGSTYDYQVLSVGNKGKFDDVYDDVYHAEDGAKIYFNTYLSAKGLHDNAQTDRVLINGDVQGQTEIYVRPVSKTSTKHAKSKKDSEGISLIQVSGTAHQDSFKLHGDYVALRGSPYQYRLHAYYGVADGLKGEVGKRFVKGEGKFWNFYLKSAYVGRPGHPRPDEPEIRVVVPQVPTYLLLPNTLFQSGLADLNNQNKRLETMRFSVGGLLKSDPISAIFLRGYGSNYQYTSNLSAFEYGYGGELDYNSVEAGVLLKTIDGAYSTTSLGIIGTYGKVSLQPLDVDQSQNSALDKWTMTAYGSTRYDNGLYVDGLVSYGLFQGDVSTLARGKTATLKGNPLNVSVTAGKALMAGSRDLVFDPQVQVVYQHLHFKEEHDIDGFDIKMGHLDQWVMRAGGRLTKTLPVMKDARVVSFYGKLHLSHSFGEKHSVHFKDAFQLGAFGSSLDAGVGFNAQLFPNLALHGDLTYQHKLTKAGFSGTSFSGGLHYHF
ncbi:autotransporter outer membrane beta-barrel domain-containing protein [Bartonella sp. B30(2025)]